MAHNLINPLAPTHTQVWLHSLVDMLRPRFAKIGYDLPRNIRCSVSAISKRKTLGICFSKSTMAENDYFHVEITAYIDSPPLVAHVLVHELIHTIVPGCGHKKPFAAIAEPMGLVPPWRSTTAGPALEAHLRQLIGYLGPYPHKALNRRLVLSKPTKLPWTAYCPGCKSKVSFQYATALRGVTVICDNPECDNCGEEMEHQSPG